MIAVSISSSGKNDKIISDYRFFLARNPEENGTFSTVVDDFNVEQKGEQKK